MDIYDSQSPGFVPWWERIDDPEEFDRRLARLNRAVWFCKGRAADLKPHLLKHIYFLESYRNDKFGELYS